MATREATLEREATLDALKANPEVSVLIVGGGVNGIGTFRDLALQGVDVLLVEMNDFSSGASAASSHMVHGGLRYLENGEFRLVREALHERNRLLINAPHQVKPLPTTIPIFYWFSGMLNAPLKFLGLLDKPSNRGAIIIKAGLTMYDIFAARQRTMPRHRVFSREQSLRRRPELNADIVATATYYDAWMPYPERICLELVLDAEAANENARALNYMKAVDADGDTVTISDELTGETYTVKPKVVINAAGPWIDLANKELKRETRFIGGTKGSHILVDHPELHAATQGQEIFFENSDGRITLFFPLMERVLIGTTDIRIDDPDEAVCTEDEIKYMLDMVKVVFPNIDVKRSDIVFAYSGVRPLPASDANTTGQISRDHSIKTVEPGNGVSFPIHSLVGGKWTSFRAFSEQTTDLVLRELNKKRQTSTTDTPIGGGKDYPHGNEQRWLAEHQLATGLDRALLDRLFDRYGTRAVAMAEFIKQGEDAPLKGNPEYTRREVLYIAQHEKVIHLDDVLLRRTLLAMLGYGRYYVVLQEVAEIVGSALGWSAERQQTEIDRVIRLLKEKHNTEAIIGQAQAEEEGVTA